MSERTPWLAAPLRRLRTMPGHAWLLHGASGLGQYELALELARAWLCDQPGEDFACGVCPSCHGIDVRTHPDLLVLMPETQMMVLNWPLSEKAQTEIDEKKRKPSREIRVEALRDTVEFAQRTSSRAQGKVVLVYPAERMNAISANALLKTLEEPPGAVRFVLASEASHQLLPTIRSRCLGHAMDWPPKAQALEWLAAQGVPAGDCAALLRAAGGRPQEALACHTGGRDAAFWRRLPRMAANADAAALAGLPAPDLIDALQKLCHDQLARAAGAAPRFFDPADLPPAPPLAQLDAWAAALSRSARHAEHPYNAGLMTEALVSQARSALHSSPTRTP